MSKSPEETQKQIQDLNRQIQEAQKSLDEKRSEVWKEISKDCCCEEGCMRGEKDTMWMGVVMDCQSCRDRAADMILSLRNRLVKSQDESNRHTEHLEALQENGVCTSPHRKGKHSTYRRGNMSFCKSCGFIHSKGETDG